MWKWSRHWVYVLYAFYIWKFNMVCYSLTLNHIAHWIKMNIATFHREAPKHAFAHILIHINKDAHWQKLKPEQYKKFQWISKENIWNT